MSRYGNEAQPLEQSTTVSVYLLSYLTHTTHIPFRTFKVQAIESTMVYSTGLHGLGLPRLLQAPKAPRPVMETKLNLSSGQRR